VLGLVGSVNRHAEILGLLFGQGRELDADFFEMQTGDFFVEFLREDVNARLVFIFAGPEVELREDPALESSSPCR